MYGMSQGLVDRSVVGDFTRYFLDSMYYTPKDTTINHAMKINH